MTERRRAGASGGGRAGRIMLLLFASGFAAPVVYALLNLDHYGKAPANFQFVLWVLLPVLALGSALAAWLAGPARRGEIAMLLVSGIFALYLAEGAITWMGSRELSAGFDTRTRLEVMRDLAGQGVEAYPAIFPGAVLKRQPDGVARPALGDAGLLPLGGISKLTTIVCNETGDYLVYAADEHGFHNPAGLWSSASLDVAAVGDSFTHGYCVGSGENYVARIRERFPATLNLGQSGNGPLLNLASIIEFLPEFAPRHVLWFHFEGNDLTDLELERHSPLLMRYLRGDGRQGLRARQAEIDAAYIAYIEERMERNSRAYRQREAIRFFVKLTQLRSLLNLTFGYEISPYAPLFTEVLEKAGSTVESWGGRLHFVFLPDANRYRIGGQDPRQNATRDRVLAAARELGIPVIDIDEVFSAHPEPASLFAQNQGTPMGGHFTAESNALVAAAVLDALRGQP